MITRGIGMVLLSHPLQKAAGLLLIFLTLAACSGPNVPNPLTQARNTGTKESVESWQLLLSRPLSDVPSSYEMKSGEMDAGSLEPNLLGVSPNSGSPNSFNFAIFDYHGPGTYHITANAVSPQQSQSFFEVEAGRHNWGTRAQYGVQSNSMCTVTVSSVVSVPAPAGIGNTFHEVTGTAACHALPSFDQNDPTADLQNGVFDVIVISNPT
jgi:hypothetical protein